MKYLESSFTVPVQSKEYTDNWERTFGKKEKDVESMSESSSDSGGVRSSKTKEEVLSEFYADGHGFFNMIGSRFADISAHPQKNEIISRLIDIAQSMADIEKILG